MKIGVIGLGAIGSILAARFALTGQEVHVVCKHEETLRVVKESGITITGVRDNYVVKSNVIPVLHTKDLPDNMDAIVLVTKATDVLDAVNEAVGKLAENGKLVTTQNGVIEESLVDIVEPRKITASVISFGATLHGPAYSEQTSHGEIVVGALTKEELVDPVNKLIFKLFSNVEPTKWTNNIIGYKYSKLLINSAISALGAVSGMTLGKMLQRKYTRLAFLRVITEGYYVAQAYKIKLEVLNRLNYQSIILPMKPTNLDKFSISLWKRHLILKLIGRKYKSLKSSTLQSIEKGRPSEIDFLNGHLVRKGKEKNLDVRLNEFIVDVVKSIERKESEPSLENLRKVEDELKAIYQF